MKQRGQTILALILVMTVALAIGLSIVQKSLVDVSTSSKVEQSSRAFSAAEAGIEKALRNLDSGGSLPSPFPLPNSSEVQDITSTGLLPATAVCGTRQQPLEIGSVGDPTTTKDDVAQVWLADFNSNTNPPAVFYDPSPCPSDPSPNRQLEVYWGSNFSTDKTALNLTLIYWDGASYKSRKWFLDDDPAATRDNGFEDMPCSGNYSLTGYKCYKKLGDNIGRDNGPLQSGLMLLRARFFYNTEAQPFAVWAVGICGPSCSLPPQTRVLTSTGISGETRRRVQLRQQSKVVPPIFDYAIFSAGDISK